MYMDPYVLVDVCFRCSLSSLHACIQRTYNSHYRLDSQSMYRYILQLFIVLCAAYTHIEILTFVFVILGTINTCLLQETIYFMLTCIFQLWHTLLLQTEIFSGFSSGDAMMRFLNFLKYPLPLNKWFNAIVKMCKSLTNSLLSALICFWFITFHNYTRKLSRPGKKNG